MKGIKQTHRNLHHTGICLYLSNAEFCVPVNGLFRSESSAHYSVLLAPTNLTLSRAIIRDNFLLRQTSFDTSLVLPWFEFWISHMRGEHVHYYSVRARWTNLNFHP
ncbi:hypothetical protein CRM22_008554 [Opisthorchis felineus]|uniref:Uncharacterized protein n=1 Tax=Opisthorchis felineus TaxID=147828 RepID=A0A4S2LB95_OPIFE|nr:hypothetical protein CRM22_008554 [Opisthorchis felineus]